MDLGKIFFAPIVPFVGHPERVAAVTALFLVVFLVLRVVRRSWPWPLLWATGFWGAFAIWEWIILRQGANIRVDLFLIYPVLLVVSLWSFWVSLRKH